MGLRIFPFSLSFVSLFLSFLFSFFLQFHSVCLCSYPILSCSYVRSRSPRSSFNLPSFLSLSCPHCLLLCLCIFVDNSSFTSSQLKVETLELLEKQEQVPKEVWEAFRELRSGVTSQQVQGEREREKKEGRAENDLKQEGKAFLWQVEESALGKKFPMVYPHRYMSLCSFSLFFSLSVPLYLTHSLFWTLLLPVPSPLYQFPLFLSIILF